MRLNRELFVSAKLSTILRSNGVNIVEGNNLTSRQRELLLLKYLEVSDIERSHMAISPGSVVGRLVLNSKKNICGIVKLIYLLFSYRKKSRLKAGG